MKIITNIICPVFALFAFACFALAPQARATCQEGCDTTNNNTFLGDNALISNGSGTFNTAVGVSALYSNTFGLFNTATGGNALSSNTTGKNNTAVGFGALELNISGSSNTATGNDALFDNTTGKNNTADGSAALIDNTTGSSNTAIGFNALLFNTSGRSNIAMGYQAGQNLTTGSNNIDIGNLGVVGEGSTIRIGVQGTQTNAYIAGISGTAVIGRPVFVNSNGQLGVPPSSRRFKTEIKPMDKASEAILALQPVTFRYKQELDPKGIPQFGLVAEQVEKVNPDLVARDAEGKAYSVRYEAVNAMLLNEFLKEHKKVEQLEATAARQQKEIATLTAGLQKVSAQVELKQPSPQMAITNP